MKQKHRNLYGAARSDVFSGRPVKQKGARPITARNPRRLDAKAIRKGTHNEQT